MSGAIAFFTSLADRKTAETITGAVVNQTMLQLLGLKLIRNRPDDGFYTTPSLWSAA